ncbi:MAG TPA: PAS domain-containing protein [Burkholderiales bacterium]|nr:PAS domain-containing protein [Burkholderiales bacterium]
MSDLSQLRESEERYALAMRAINEAIYDYDVAEDHIYYSERVYDVLDVDRAFMQTAKDWRSLIHAEDVAHYMDVFRAHVEARTPRIECDYRYRARSGEWRWCRQHGIALRDARGRAARVVGSIGDITEFKKTEEALRRSEERYDLALQAVREGIYDWDIANNSIYYSERVIHMLGLSPEHMRTAADWHQRIHDEDRTRYDAALIAHFKGGTERFECEFRYRAEDGSWRWARQHGIAQRDAAGRAVRMIGSTGDISRLKRTEEALRQSEERYSTATSVATEGIYEWDIATDELLITENAREFFRPAGKQTARVWTELVHPDDLDGYRRAIGAHFKRLTPRLEHEYRIAATDGGYRWIVDRAIALRDPHGRAIKMIGAITDVTRRKLAELDLQRAREQAEAASREKSQFLANMSHELRTPLNAIIGFSEVLKEGMFGELNAKQAEYVTDILESGQHLLSLINDVLDLSKIEAGRMELDLSEFALATAIERAASLVKERAQRHGVRLQIDIPPGIGSVIGDERKVKQIMLNLLSNAVKFTPEGGTVIVSARLRDEAAEITVRDTGAGMTPEDQAALFQEFRQVGRDSTRKAEGTGLGLVLTKRFVELHGGTIRVESAPGKGSAFTITLPLQSPRDQ